MVALAGLALAFNRHNDDRTVEARDVSPAPFCVNKLTLGTCLHPGVDTTGAAEVGLGDIYQAEQKRRSVRGNLRIKARRLGSRVALKKELCSELPRFWRRRLQLATLDSMRWPPK